MVIGIVESFLYCRISSHHSYVDLVCYRTFIWFLDSRMLTVVSSSSLPCELIFQKILQCSFNVCLSTIFSIAIFFSVICGGFCLFVCFLVLPLHCYQPISLHSRAHMLSHVTPWTAARQAFLSMDFSRQEYWSGLPFPSPSCVFLKNIYLLVASGLSCSTWDLSLRARWLQVVWVRQLGLAGLVAPQHMGSQFPDQGLNLCPLHWKMNSQPLDHQGSLCLLFLIDILIEIIIQSHMQLKKIIQRFPCTLYPFSSSSNILQKYSIISTKIMTLIQSINLAHICLVLLISLQSYCMCRFVYPPLSRF